MAAGLQSRRSIVELLADSASGRATGREPVIPMVQRIAPTCIGSSYQKRPASSQALPTASASAKARNSQAGSSIRFMRPRKCRPSSGTASKPRSGNSNANSCTSTRSMRLSEFFLRRVFDEDAGQPWLLTVPMNESLAHLFALGLHAFRKGVDEFRGAGVLSQLHSRLGPRLR